MRTVETVAEVRAELGPHRGVHTVGLVPTMGAFHDGHLALIRAAREECDVVVVSLFVNPTQFGEGEDFSRYPRDPGRDGALAAGAGADVLFVPPVAEIYPDGFSTWVDVEGVSAGLEGSQRPGHFRAVATVCLKLFSIVRPDRAYFGAKDAQQVAVVGRLVRDLDLELEVRVVPTVRDADGLALSSRNGYLSPAERQLALALPRALQAGRAARLHGGRPEEVARDLLRAAPGLALDYCELARWNGRLVLAAAVRVGATRLIDNVVLEGDTP